MNYKVVLSDKAYKKILLEVHDKLETETGGIFLGFCKNYFFYILEVIDPGPESIFQVSYFEYDHKYVNHVAQVVNREYISTLNVIGLWHRHPGSLDKFSAIDDGTNVAFAELNEEGAISAIVNVDPDFRLTFYHVDKYCNYNQIEYSVGTNNIPQILLGEVNNNDILEKINKYKKNSIMEIFKKNKLKKQKEKKKQKIINTLEHFENNFFHRDYDLSPNETSDISYYDLILKNKNKSYLDKKIPVKLVFTSEDIYLYFSQRCYIYKGGLLQELINSYITAKYKKNKKNTKCVKQNRDRFRLKETKKSRTKAIRFRNR